MQMLRREVHSFELSVCVPDTTAAPTVIITGGNLTFREDKKKNPQKEITGLGQQEGEIAFISG